MMKNKKIDDEDLKLNRYIGFWEGIYNDTTDTLMGFYMDNDTNKDRYRYLMDWILTDDIEYKKKMISYYYSVDKKFYNYAMKNLLEEQKIQENEDEEEL